MKNPWRKNPPAPTQPGAGTVLLGLLLEHELDCRECLERRDEYLAQKSADEWKRITEVFRPAA